LLTLGVMVLRRTVCVMLPVRLVVRVLVGEDVLLHGLGYPFHLTRMQATSRTTERVGTVG
jgi:hypothetical protein